MAAVSAVEQTFDFIVIDTPGSDSYLMRLAHSMADYAGDADQRQLPGISTCSYVDAANYSVTGESHYAEMVRDARRKRRQLDGSTTDWIVVRNRLSMLGSRNKQLVASGLKELSLRLGFRAIDGFAERVVYREFFPRGLTALDDLNEVTLGNPSEPRACDGARGGHGPFAAAEPAARRTRPPPRRQSGRVVRPGRQAARSPRHSRRLRFPVRPGQATSEGVVPRSRPRETRR